MKLEIVFILPKSLRKLVAYKMSNSEIYMKRYNRIWSRIHPSRE